MESLASRAIRLRFTLRGGGRSAAATRRAIAALARQPTSFRPPRGLSRRVDLRMETSAAGWPVYTVTPRGARADLDRVVYVHGGAYFREITRQHWTFVAGLARRAGVEVVVPIYPLAPCTTADVIVPAAVDLAEVLGADAGPDRLTMMGDSAGGGLVLAVAAQLRARTGIAPAHTILISPWLDVAVDDPEIASLAPHDPCLSPDGLRAAGDAYRGPLSARDPLVSPLRADLDDLGRITVFTGTRDIVHADARRLRERMTGAAAGFEYHEAPGMLHVYPLLRTPEGRAARRQLAAAVRSSVASRSGR
ncbi:alpha/beta hydrolase [Rhodococcus spelaei]|uniref:Alpha/beta hydrolase n=1 Tax=Rhodococcus spelaei TaxID=2546320 RepID=A0A541B1Y0_9NOCA|nr:alpha/beta hydrolase fold domain-containing protein [Rhodococcus spelaei]TQF66329.1 alpha/beta hydrolase [Rhodococcus spelaei]